MSKNRQIEQKIQQLKENITRILLCLPERVKWERLRWLSKYFPTMNI